MTTVEVKTGIWREEKTLALDFPENWEVEVFWPDLPKPMTDMEVRDSLESPVGQASLRELAAGKSHPCIIVDDLTRPTPVRDVMPHVLAQLREAGIAPENVTVIVGTGTHADQDRNDLRAKLGREAVESCRLIVHSDLRNNKYIGKTSFKTPVFVDQAVLASDLVFGIGGIYPQHTTGFGGGGKLALGVLGRRSIIGLHYGHKSVGGNYNVENDFRRDVTEMAHMMGLETIITLHVDSFLRVVKVTAGDYDRYYRDAAEFSLQRYRAKVAQDADVVIANAYPFDTSLTFMRKGYQALVVAPRSAMKIIVGAAHEGPGFHGIFSHGFSKPPRFARLIELRRKAIVMGPRKFAEKAFARILRKAGAGKPNKAAPTGSGESFSVLKGLPRNTDHLWLFRTTDQGAAIEAVPGITVLHQWSDVIAAIRKERGDEALKVRIYPCSPLQTVDL